ncbi:uncharacterized protein LOC143634394 [Bidens hawaiensis]|uniref:uncharacterized protein LOC143634394 n=1 Tax=Bidens hawaiensis TaxID=980011 RepID=UPI00404B80F6
MLHMVGKKPKQTIKNVSGAALEMQRELSWYKEVEQLIPPSYRKRKNNAGETPRVLFAKEHAYLVSKGEDWMNNYMVVATLIATIVFAAAFTLPGGYDQNTGIPFFSKKPSLIIFVISDAVSLISSSTSVLIFLSIPTSRYAERDFMQSLPRRLMFGIATLFLSVVTMMVAFSASFFLLYNEKLKWVPITITCLAGVPVILFVKMQFHLLRTYNELVIEKYVVDDNLHPNNDVGLATSMTSAIFEGETLVVTCAVVEEETSGLEQDKVEKCAMTKKLKKM